MAGIVVAVGWVEMNLEREYLAGLDLGKLADFSAFALFERTRPALAASTVQVVDDPLYGRQTTVTPPRVAYSGQLTKDEQKARRWSYELVRMKRWPENNKSTDNLYDEMIQWVVKAYSKTVDRGGLAGTTLALDYTGVGVPVMEWMCKELRIAGSRANVRPIWIHGGGRVAENLAGGWNVPKRDLVSAVQATLGTSRLVIRRALENCGTLLDELYDFKLKISLETGHDSYEAWREKTHDDQVLACAIALWTGESGQKEMWVK